MPGRYSSSGAGHQGRPHPSRRVPAGRTVLASSRPGPRTVLASSSGTVAPGYGSAGATVVDDPPEAPPAPDRRQRRKAKRRRRSGGERLLRWSVGVVAVILVVTLVGYGYVRYRWGQILTASCSTCTTAANGQPFNVLIVGSDSRAGVTGKAAQSFGSASQVGGQRSDTIKILHVDPAKGTARLLSIPRDTFVDLSDIPASSGLTGGEKINSAFNNGPEPLIATIQNTFGISISHFVIVNFEGLTNAVNTIGGIYLDFPYPVRDNDNGNNNSGLKVTRTGCQLVNGTTTLALARSRFFQYYMNGSWHYDPSSDFGRIERQNLIIQAVVSKAKSSINPIILNSLLGSVVHDIVVDRAMTFGDMLSLGLKYNAFSPSKLLSYTLPTTGAVSSYAGDVQVVQQPQAQNMLTEFLGTAPGTVTTPPLDGYGSPVEPPPPTTTTTAPSGSGSSGSKGTSSSGAAPSATAPSFDPTVCHP